MATIKDSSPTRYLIKQQGHLLLVLDAWHPSVADLDESADVPPDSPALTVLTDGQVDAIIQKLGIGTHVTKEKVQVINQLTREKPKSESFLLKKEALDAILKLCGMQDVSSLRQ